MAIGRDPAGEATPERNANSLLDLLLDSDRRPGDELVRLLVEEQHRAGVHLEQVAGGREQLGEQRVQVEVRKRRVGDRLEPQQTRGLVRAVSHPARTLWRRSATGVVPRPCATSIRLRTGGR